MDVDRYRVRPGSTVRLARCDPSDTSAFDGSKEDAEAVLRALTSRLEALQEMLYAEGRRRVLVVLQGMDTSGKDGVVRHVFEGVNPLGVKVASFKVPTPPELAHDYLWRVHPHVPASGEIVIFNRSHYEDVLVVRVRNLAPEETWSRRYDHIKAFEQLLVDEGTTILKFFLHISRDEQRARLEERRDDPGKRWKFSMGDLAERERWSDYLTAYEDALSRTSTDQAPWYIVPADKKWFRNLVVSRVIVDMLESFGMRYPQPAEDISGITVPK